MAYLSVHFPLSSRSNKTSPSIFIRSTPSFKEKFHKASLPRLIFLTAGDERHLIQPVKKMLFKFHWKVPMEFPSSSKSMIELSLFHLSWERTVIPSSELIKSYFTVHSGLEQNPQSGVQQLHVGYTSGSGSSVSLLPTSLGLPRIYSPAIFLKTILSISTSP